MLVHGVLVVEVADHPSGDGAEAGEQLVQQTDVVQLRQPGVQAAPRAQQGEQAVPVGGHGQQLGQPDRLHAPLHHGQRRRRPPAGREPGRPRTRRATTRGPRRPPPGPRTGPCRRRPTGSGRPGRPPVERARRGQPLRARQRPRHGPAMTEVPAHQRLDLRGDGWRPARAGARRPPPGGRGRARSRCGRPSRGSSDRTRSRKSSARSDLELVDRPEQPPAGEASSLAAHTSRRPPGEFFTSGSSW